MHVLKIVSLAITCLSILSRAILSIHFILKLKAYKVIRTCKAINFRIILHVTDHDYTTL